MHVSECLTPVVASWQYSLGGNATVAPARSTTKGVQVQSKQYHRVLCCDCVMTLNCNWGQNLCKVCFANRNVTKPFDRALAQEFHFTVS